MRGKSPGKKLSLNSSSSSSNSPAVTPMTLSGAPGTPGGASNTLSDAAAPAMKEQQQPRYLTLRNERNVRTRGGALKAEASEEDCSSSSSNGQMSSSGSALGKRGTKKRLREEARQEASNSNNSSSSRGSPKNGKWLAQSDVRSNNSATIDTISGDLVFFF